MTKEIIIDGVNVAECMFLKGKHEIMEGWHKCTRRDDEPCNLEIGYKFVDWCNTHGCYYKQLQREKQKNEEWEKLYFNQGNNLGLIVNANEMKARQIIDYKQALADIKEIADGLSDDCSNYEENSDCTKCVGNMLCISYIKDLILAKINEVCGDNE